MTDTTTTATTTAQAAQNYILYRTKALMLQPQYTYLKGDTPVVPAAVVAGTTGTVIATASFTSLDNVTAGDGFAYALDADGKFPIGSIYTPAATTS